MSETEFLTAGPQKLFKQWDIGRIIFNRHDAHGSGPRQRESCCAWKSTARVCGNCRVHSHIHLRREEGVSASDLSCCLIDRMRVVAVLGACG